MKKILIIEDDTTLQKVYKEVLLQEGFEVIAVGTGQDGLQELMKNPVDLILLDIMLPGGMNGFDVLMHIKKQHASLKNIPVIVLSNLDSEKQAAIDYGASDFFFKATMELQSLVEKIKHILS